MRVSWTRIPRTGDSPPLWRSYARRAVRLAYLSERLHGTRPGPGAAVGVVGAAVALAGTAAQLAHGGIFGASAAGELDATSWFLSACTALPLIAWRRVPGLVFVFTACAAVLLAALGYVVVLPFGPAIALYLLVATRDRDYPWRRHGIAGVVALFALYLVAAAIGGDGFPGRELVHSGLAWAVAWFAGERTRLRRQHLHELRDRAVRAERDGERERQLAVAEERARIARDLHDAAGHAINVIAVRAGTARLRDDPERSRAALAAIEELARNTAAEIDEIVGTLRDRADTDGAVEAPPGLASLSTLVSRHAAAGLEVSVATDGEPRPLDGPVDRAAFRILQEALTNAARHGTGPARVTLAFGEDSLELTVSNPSPDRLPARSNGGHGLIGMRERATLLGGRLESGRANRSFLVRAEIPYGSRTR
jgi:signal transduction histidine kinase